MFSDIFYSAVLDGMMKSSKIRFRHQSSDLHRELKPPTHDEVRERRRSSYPMDKRIETEKEYQKHYPGRDKNLSFIYAAVGGKHNMTPAKDYPGYTHYFDLSPEQIENALFEVIHAKGSTKARKGKKGLDFALRHWEEVKRKGNDRHVKYKDGWVLKPRIEVIIPDKVKPKSYVPQVEDRFDGDREYPF